MGGYIAIRWIGEVLFKAPFDKLRTSLSRMGRGVWGVDAQRLLFEWAVPYGYEKRYINYQ
ncbi:hypothetical protein B9T07_09380 [Limnospira fusiformis CCALA 023]|nr:hypothetical protein AP285_05660 [Arthrospira platensis YZ]KDR55903.1 hypothetical protein APPUASWS_020350 [Arthrospira platensis str. Paraca]BDT11509.1 hypothetical protein N39L_12320 [Arthrospira platensis NIES-39]